MAPHEPATAAPHCTRRDDEKTAGREAVRDGSDDATIEGQRCFIAESAAFLEACDAEPTATAAWLSAARGRAPTAKKARRAYALALATFARPPRTLRKVGRCVDVRRQRRRARRGCGSGRVALRRRGARRARRRGPGCGAGVREALGRRVFSGALRRGGRAHRRAPPPPRTRRCPATAPPRSSPRATFKARWRPTTRPWRRTRPAGGAAGRGAVRGRRWFFSASRSMRRRKPNDDRTQAQGLALDDDDDDERRVETAASPRPRQGRGGPRVSSGASTFSPPSRRARPRRPPSPRSKAAAFGANARAGARREARRPTLDGARPDRPVALRRPRNFERRRRRRVRRAYRKMPCATIRTGTASPMPSRRRRGVPRPSTGASGARTTRSGLLSRRSYTPSRYRHASIAAASSFSSSPGARPQLLRVGLDSRGDARLQLRHGLELFAGPLARRAAARRRRPPAPAPQPLPLPGDGRERRLARLPARGGAPRRAVPGRRRAEQRRRQGGPAAAPGVLRPPRAHLVLLHLVLRHEGTPAAVGPLLGAHAQVLPPRRPAAANRGRPRTCRRRRRGRPGPCRRPLAFLRSLRSFCCRKALLSESGTFQSRN